MNDCMSCGMMPSSVKYYIENKKTGEHIHVMVCLDCWKAIMLRADAIIEYLHIERPKPLPQSEHRAFLMDLLGCGEVDKLR